MRVTLDLPNRRLFDSFEARAAAGQGVPQRSPRLVIGLGGKTPMASPDHYQALAHNRGRGVRFQADQVGPVLRRPARAFDRPAPGNVAQLCIFAPAEANGIVIDIGDTLETKLTAIACYKTQFLPEKATPSSASGHSPFSRAWQPVSRRAKSW